MTERPIDLCLVTEYYYPTLSGATERFRRYATGLKKRSIEMRVMTIKRGVAHTHENQEGVPVMRFFIENNSKMPPSAMLLGKVYNHFQTYGQWPQVLQIISHTLQGTPTVWRLRLKGVPCVNIITMIPIIPSHPLAVAKRWLHQSLRYSPFNLLITSSIEVSHNLTKLGVSSKRLKVIPNGVDINRFHPIDSIEEKQTIRRELRIDPNDEIILFVGFISYRKGVDLLFEAWPRIISSRPNARMILIGPTEDPSLDISQNSSVEKSFFQQVMETVASLPFSERIAFLGEVNNIEKYMMAADLLILPSRHEGWGNVVAEAMACGLPCIVTPYKGLPSEFGKPDHEFLLASFSPESISEKIIEVFENPDKKRQIQKTAREWSETHLDVEKSLDQYASLYQLISRRDY